MNPYRDGIKSAGAFLGMRPDTLEHVADLAGLGTLAVMPAYHLLKKNDAPPSKADQIVELAGLGLLATPVAMRLLRHA